MERSKIKVQVNSVLYGNRAEISGGPSSALTAPPISPSPAGMLPRFA